MEEFFTINNNTTAEIVEKKSQFIANLFFVKNKEMAENLIKETKKKYHDARHNCIAYRILTDNTIIEKLSDDGEPSGTAGAPMLDIIRKYNLCNVLIIVTRYFGGILLGTGGLVRAYSSATIKAIEGAEKIYMCKGYEMQIEIDYNNLEVFKYYCKKNNIQITNITYLDVVICNIELEKHIKEKIIDDINKKEIKINNVKVLCEKYINKKTISM